MSDDFAKEVRELFDQAQEADKTNRAEALADLKFAGGEHWNPEVRAWREQQGRDLYGFPLPCLTVHTVPQLIGQVIGDRRANATSIKVLPREDGDKKVAEVRGELIRSIELQSKAERVFTQAFDNQVTCGIGNFRVELDYAYEDAFERDLFIRSIPNPLAVLWDPLAADTTGRDAKFCFVSDRISKEEYERRFKDAAKADMFDTEATAQGWYEDGAVRVAEYHQIVEKPRTIAMMQDGSVQDVTDKPRNNWLPRVMVGANDKPVIREKAMCKYAKMTLTNGQEELDDPFEIKLHRLPIIRVMGREVWQGDKRIRFGLTRFVRDSAMLKDYFRSVRAELLMLAPRHNFIGPVSAFKDREGDFRNVLMYNDSASIAPTEVTNNKLPALLSEEQMFAQDLKDITGIHDASLGIKSNETSGIAIQRRQHEGDIATIIYHENMNAAQQECGEVLNALIPLVYDTARTIRTIGADDAVKLLRVNDPNDPEAIDLGIGKYDIMASTGPAYQTQRQEQAAQLMQLAQQSPKFVDVVPDYIVKALDIRHGDEMAERLKRTVPPELLGDEAREEDPEQAAAAQAKAQEAEQMQRTLAELNMRKLAAETDESEAKARKANAEAEKAQAEADEIKAGLALKGAALAEQATNDDDEEDPTMDLPDPAAFERPGAEL